MIAEIRNAFWTAPALWRFARKPKNRRISSEPFCAHDNLICYILSGLEAAQPQFRW
jgi:hypothetical protein